MNAADYCTAQYAEMERKAALRVLNLADYRATRFKGDPPQPKWLIDGSIPLGVPVLPAGNGRRRQVIPDFATRRHCRHAARTGRG